MSKVLPFSNPDRDDLTDILISLLGHFEKNMDMNVLLDKLPLSTGKLLPSSFVIALQRAGLKAEITKLPLEFLSQEKLPVVILRGCNRAVVLYNQSDVVRETDLQNYSAESFDMVPEDNYCGYLVKVSQPSDFIAS